MHATKADVTEVRLTLEQLFERGGLMLIDTARHRR